MKFLKNLPLTFNFLEKMLKFEIKKDQFNIIVYSFKYLNFKFQKFNFPEKHAP